MATLYEVICIGKLKSGSPFYDLNDEYVKRLGNLLSLTVLEGKNQQDEWDKIESKLHPEANLIVLDEKGKSLPSVKFAHKIEHLKTNKNGKIQFVIGGADGLSKELRQRADLTLSFGEQTWPHMMARCMLLEQIYRAEKIIAKHPYHRE